jgi:DNA helicase-2/ATP-dependent DNA helicase PcrA
MIELDDFFDVTRRVLRRGLNDAQVNCLRHDDRRNLLIVAGPGSGKTTVLVLRALRHVLVDGRVPDRILITTFTRKAAKELRTRWLDWGTALVSHLSSRRPLRDRLAGLDLNRCRIDTLDSIAQQTLTDYKLAGEVVKEVIEDATANLVLKRRAFSAVYSRHQSRVDQLLARYSFDGKAPGNRGEALSLVRTLCDRLIHDRIDLVRYAARGPGEALIAEIARGYWQHLEETGLLDFATLEQTLLSRICNGTLDTWLSEITTLLVDEYQDTNPLQEEIYFEVIARAASRVTVVGDDDQAMYRFRGGSVELFTQFADRCRRRTGRATRRVNMVTNYRSSAEIVGFYNAHIRGDLGFGPARIIPPKPEVLSERGPLNFPVLGMFRESPAVLASSLAGWLDELFRARHFRFRHHGRHHEVILSPENALGDCVLLSHTVDEVKYKGFQQNTAEVKFPGILRAELQQRGYLIFNPRGRTLRNIPPVQRLLGLILIALDPDGQFTSEVDRFYVTREARYYLDVWRAAAEAFVRTDPIGGANSRLRTFIGDWQRASRGERAFEETEWPILELIFKLITWIPGFQNEPEHQVWLEAIARAFTSAGIESAYRMQINQRDPHRIRSRQILIRDGLVPIAEDVVAVDEDIMPSVPRTHLQLMTIHQAKGLEFPLVIVDVASAFKGNYPAQAFRRFPRSASNVATLEDDVEPFLPTPLRTGRRALDRTFDDLVRLYYVAYSRPQSALLLVGCEQCLKYGTGRDLRGSIPHIGLGWRRDGSWPWRQPVTPGRPPPVVVEPPFFNIT